MMKIVFIKSVLMIANYNANEIVFLGIMIMKNVFKSIAFSNALGNKRQILSVMLGASLCLGAISISHAAPARNINPPSLQANAPHVYVVKKGDTLWDISKKFLKNPYRWREIWAGNQHVKNPHWIFPGDRLLMCSYNGQPLIGKDEGDGCEGIIRRHTNTVNVAPQIRIEDSSRAISVIPYENIRHWLERTTIFAPESLTHIPYVLGTADQRVLAAKGQNIYVRGQGLVTGQRYAIYREGKPYSLPNTDGKSYVAGLELQQVASGIATQINGDITTLELTDTYTAEVRKGDRAMPEHDHELPNMFYPTDAKDIIEGGRIIRVMGSIATAAKHSVVTVDRGLSHGIKSGDVFNIMQQGEIVTDPVTRERIQLPQQQIGQLMIFKAFDHLSYAYVLESSLPIKVGASIMVPNLEE